MQGYSKGRVGPSITVHYNGKVEASMVGYIKVSVALSITVHYISLVEASIQTI
jgi:hypothetical protein